ncbi:MAG: hypothetical protein ABR865_13485 [Terracidiphilus sp.]|jgi:hypothetical protein
MHQLITAVSLSLLAAAAAGKTSPSAKIAQLPKGMLAGHVYTNDAVGVTYEYPSDWTATTDLKDPSNLDPGHSNGAANRCSEVLLWLTAPQKEEGRFSAMAALIAIDPRCLTIVPFPKSMRDQEGLNDAESVIIKCFKNSPFLPSDRVTIFVSEQRGQVVFQLIGAMTMNAIEGHPAPKQEPLIVHTSFEVTESKGFWIAWAYVADASSAEELKQVKISFQNGLAPHYELGAKS